VSQRYLALGSSVSSHKITEVHGHAHSAGTAFQLVDDNFSITGRVENYTAADNREG
jgi:geranylgeranyl pyrophosphate synthase